MFPNLNLNFHKKSVFKLSLSSLPLESNKNKLITSFSKFEPTSLGLYNSTQGEFLLIRSIKRKQQAIIFFLLVFYLPLCYVGVVLKLKHSI
jgi:hypothetical protein